VFKGFRVFDSALLGGRQRKLVRQLLTKTDRSLLPSAKTAEEVAEEEQIASGSAENFSGTVISGGRQ
jgi:hypothetical protein